MKIWKWETSEETGVSIMQIAKRARKEGGQKLFQIFKQEENEVDIASWAMWDAQLKGLVELERSCQELMQEVGGAVKRKTRSSGWPHGRQDQSTE